MPQVVYCGPIDEVDLPALNLRAKPGQPVEVSDEAAESLLAQADNWAPVGSPAAKAAAKRIADAEKRVAAEVAAAQSAPAVAGQEG